MMDAQLTSRKEWQTEVRNQGGESLYFTVRPRIRCTPKVFLWLVVSRNRISSD